MALLDRLVPAWRHSDPEVRAAAVRELGKDAAETLAAVARDDADARIRRIALKKVDNPELLLEIARTDGDEELRALAGARAGEMLVERAISRQPEETCARAVAELTRAGDRVTVAVQAFHPSVRRAALHGVSDERPLAEIARRSDDPQIGLEALAGVNDPALVRRVAAATRQEVALAALARLNDPEMLLAIADDAQAHKGVRKRARAMLDQVLTDDHPIRIAERRARQRQLCDTVDALGDAPDPAAALAVLRQAESDWRELSARVPADPELETRFQGARQTAGDAITRALARRAEAEKRDAARRRAYADRQHLCETVEALEGADTPARLDAARAAWQALGPTDDPRRHELAARFTLAVERCAHRYERWRVREGFRAQLEALVHEAERLAAAGDPQAAARPRAALERRWAQLASSSEGAKWMASERTLQRRFADAGTALHTQAETRQAERQQREREAIGHVKGLCARLEQLAQADTFRRASADRALEAAAETLRQFPPVPASERDALRQRLTAAQETVTQRVETDAAAEGWKRWANADVQQKLCERAEALLAGDDANQILREVGELEREWARFAVAPRDQSQALWERFRRTRNALRHRCDRYLADNLAKKEALCAAVEPLAESTDWNATAAAIQQMQAEWKQIGPVRPQLAAPLLERFRTPANRFFERRQEFLRASKERRQETLGRMRQLCEAAEALAESTDWDAAAAEIKRLQADAAAAWGRRRAPAAAPAKPRRGDALQQRFQGACDRFFDRYRRRDELQLETTLAAAETILIDLEALRESIGGAAAPTPDEITQRLKDRLAEWVRAGALPPDRAAALRQRLQASCDALEAVCPEGLLDAACAAESNVGQREKLCVRLERLVASLASGTDDPSAGDLATRLKLALAANTIGGRAATQREQALREAGETAQRLREKWQRLGPVIGRQARELARRFDQAGVELDALRAPGQR
jgi:hypothetical protein